MYTHTHLSIILCYNFCSEHFFLYPQLGRELRRVPLYPSLYASDYTHQVSWRNWWSTLWHRWRPAQTDPSWWRTPAWDHRVTWDTWLQQFLCLQDNHSLVTSQLLLYLFDAVDQMFKLESAYPPSQFYSSPNVAKRSTWEQCIYWGPTTDRPTDFAFWKISNGHISAKDHPIQFMFGSMVRFSRSADRMTLLPVGPNPRSRPSAVL